MILTFVVNGQIIKPSQITVDFALDRVKEIFPAHAGKRFGYGIFGLAPSDYPLGPDVCGVLLCTRGKVIRADLFNQFPGSLGARIFGLVEIPDFAKFLTTAKTDFIRKGKHREFERLYDPIRREFKAWLGDLGIQPAEIVGSDEAVKLEREIKKLLDDVPELAELFGFRTRKTVLQPSDSDSTIASTYEGIEVTFPVTEGSGGVGPAPVDLGDQPGQTLVEDKEAGTATAKPVSRTARRGPKIAFVEAPDRIDLAWVDGNNVIINSGHPAYVKARSDATTRRLYSLFAIASGVQRFLNTQSDTLDLMFTDRMMAAWGKK